MKTLNSKFVLVLILGLFFALMACAGNAGNTNSAPAANGGPSNATVAASSSDSRIAYPQSVATEFVRSCQAAGSEAKFCACVFDKVQNKYSFEEFSIIEAKIRAGTPPEEFVEFTGRARAQCTR